MNEVFERNFCISEEDREKYLKDLHIFREKSLWDVEAEERNEYTKDWIRPESREKAVECLESFDAVVFWHHMECIDVGRLDMFWKFTLAKFSLPSCKITEIDQVKKIPVTIYNVKTFSLIVPYMWLLDGPLQQTISELTVCIAYRYQYRREAYDPVILEHEETSND